MLDSDQVGSFEGYGLQPVRKTRKTTVAFVPEGMRGQEGNLIRRFPGSSPVDEQTSMTSWQVVATAKLSLRRSGLIVLAI